MLGLLSSKHTDANVFEKHLNPVCHVGTHWIALVEHSQMSTHFSHFSGFLHNFVTVKLATTGIRVNPLSAGGSIGQNKIIEKS